MGVRAVVLPLVRYSYSGLVCAALGVVGAFSVQSATSRVVKPGVLDPNLAR
jgi:hypothetical protein